MENILDEVNSELSKTLEDKEKFDSLIYQKTLIENYLKERNAQRDIFFSVDVD